MGWRYRDAVPKNTPATRKLLAVLVGLSITLVACSDDSTNTTDGTETTLPGSETGSSGVPGSTTPTPPPTTTTLPEDNPLVRAELTVEVDGATILFDQRPFALLDGSGRVVVLDPDENVLTEGPFEGPDSVMNELPDGSFEFVDADGNVVAVMTQQQLQDALDAATPGSGG